MNKIQKNSVVLLILFVAALCSISSVALPADSETSIEQTRQALEKWVETNRLISQEKRDLELARQMLTERIELVKREIESLQSKIKEAEGSVVEADKKRASLVEENEKFKTAASALSETAGTLEGRTRKLLARLPNPIRDKVKPLSQRLPEDPNETKLSVGERFQNVIGILNEVDKFNGEVSANSEVRRLDDGKSIEVTALYIGIGQGYYVSGDGKIAGTGTATPDGWTWQQKNDAAPGISDSIAILKNEKPASFIKLPVEID